MTRACCFSEILWIFIFSGKLTEGFIVLGKQKKFARFSVYAARPRKGLECNQSWRWNQIEDKEEEKIKEMENPTINAEADEKDKSG